MKKTIALTALLMLPGHAQTAHFPKLAWREKESDHVMIRTHGTGTDPARRYAEKTYEVMAEVLPGLTADFEKNEFRTPGGAEAGAGEQFRLTTYLVESGDDFHHLVDTEAGRSNWQAGTRQVVKKVGSFEDRENRYLVICKSDPAQSGGGGATDRTPVLVHRMGGLLMKGRSRQAQLPFWMTAGMGYYAEHLVLDRCSVAYLDFDRHYAQEGDDPVNIRKGEALALGTDWTRTLRDLCKDDKRVGLADTLAAEVLNLTPNESGYLFALSYFLVSTDERAEKYQAFLKTIRDGQKVEESLLLKTYGYADAAALEKEWYEWIMSRDFR